MNISALKSTLIQPYLFDEPVRGHGHVRNVIGGLAERLTAQLVGGRRHRTDSRAEYCPDVSAGDPVRYYESKAVGRSGTAFVYGGRLVKDREFALGHELHYCVWRHNAITKNAETVSQLEALVLDSLVCAYLVPFAEIDWLCSWQHPDRLNSKYGGSDERPEYGSGFRMRLSALEKFVVRRFDGEGRPLPQDAATEGSGGDR